MTEDDLYALMTDATDDRSKTTYEVDALQVSYGTNQMPTATITLSLQEGEELIEAGTGSGSVEAIYNTLAKMTGQHYALTDYKIQSINGGEDALAEVHVKLQHEGIEQLGRGVAHDVLEASAKAYIHAVNRMIARRKHQAGEKTKVG